MTLNQSRLEEMNVRLIDEDGKACVTNHDQRNEMGFATVCEAKQVTSETR